MPKNRSKAKSVQPGPQSSQGHTGPSESPKWVEMTENGGENEFFGSQSSPDRPDPSASGKRLEMVENDRENKKSGLSFRQESALPVIAAAPTIAQAVRNSGVSESTLRRWLDDEDFREELTTLRQESAQLARQELQGLMLTGLSVISETMSDPNSSIRLRAAHYAVSFALQINEAENLRREVRELEDAVALQAARKPVH